MLDNDTTTEGRLSMIRSVRAIKGFTIKATDGEIGAVDDCSSMKIHGRCAISS